MNTINLKTPSFMIIPSLACQAACKYCFGPNEGNIMSLEIAKKTIKYIAALVSHNPEKRIEMTFHGGEPLLAPLDIFRLFFGYLPTLLPQAKIVWKIQSNLWALTEEHCELFAQYDVSIGTSLDGPQDINDLGRGKGYWRNTMSGIRLARSRGLNVGVIATVTSQTRSYWKEIIDFFIDENLNINMHFANKPLGKNECSFCLTKDEYDRTIKKILPYYLSKRKRVSISSIDDLVKSFVFNTGHVCTFKDCLGMFLAFDPSGKIYPCQRFCGLEKYSMGYINDKPDINVLFTSPTAIAMKERESKINVRCKQCQDFKYCKGGCYYNAISDGDGVLDPLCPTYQSSFKLIKTILIEEMKQKENLSALETEPVDDFEHPLLRKGPCISLFQKSHPKVQAENARTILCLYELGKSSNPELAVAKVVENEICGDLEKTREIMNYYHQKLTKPVPIRNNIYTHITFNCNLSCKHCYVENTKNVGNMDVTLFFSIIEDWKKENFRQLIITGGEPMVHPDWDKILNKCRKNRNSFSKIVLRTNFTLPISDLKIQDIAASFDQIVVSIDGNEDSHDLRRGRGSYNKAVNNIIKYQHLSKKINNAAELSIGCTISPQDIFSATGKAVKKLSADLGIKRTRFRPLLPLGRIEQEKDKLIWEGHLTHSEPQRILKMGFKPNNTCGIGHNIYIEPDGSIYPCYAFKDSDSLLGNLNNSRIETIIHSNAFINLLDCTVDKIQKCKKCDVRYICGGICRAWNVKRNKNNLYDAIINCSSLYDSYISLVTEAYNYLELD